MVQRLQGLYGLSRVLDVLVSPFQPESDDASLLDWTNPGKTWWTGQIPPPTTLRQVASDAGWAEITESRLHPFFHETVGVDEADDTAAAPEMVSEVWPGYFVGSMLLVRSSVVVCAGRDVLDPVVASSSCLYWAWWRRNRKVRDLSRLGPLTPNGALTSGATTGSTETCITTWTAATRATGSNSS